MAVDIATKVIIANDEQVGTVTYMIGGRLATNNRNFLKHGSDNQPDVNTIFNNYDDLLDDPDYYG